MSIVNFALNVISNPPLEIGDGNGGIDNALAYIFSFFMRKEKQNESGDFAWYVADNVGY